MNENVNNREQGLILQLIKELGKPTAAEIERVLLQLDIEKSSDLKAALALMVHDGLLRQSVGINGVIYLLTETGDAALKQAPISHETAEAVSEKAAEFRAIFANEQMYPAQYTEQANAIVPLFLSIRKDEKVLFKVSVIVNDLPTAVKVKENWMKNAHKAYEALWEAIGEGEPMPKF
jgi:hypothetical protein